jgi:hypothetical protein
MLPLWLRTYLSFSIATMAQDYDSPSCHCGSGLALSSPLLLWLRTSTPHVATMAQGLPFLLHYTLPLWLRTLTPPVVTVAQDLLGLLHCHCGSRLGLPTLPLWRRTYLVYPIATLAEDFDSPRCRCGSMLPLWRRTYLVFSLPLWLKALTPLLPLWRRAVISPHLILSFRSSA